LVGGGYSPISPQPTITGTSCTVTTLASATQYSFEVAAVDGNGTSVLSAAAVDTTLCLAPTNLAATGVTATSVPLTWTDSAGATGYLVVNQTTGSTTTLNSAAADAYTDTTVQGGITYTYFVYATNASGTSLASTPLQVITPSTAPSGLAGTAGNGQVSLTWAGSTGASSYNIYESAGSGYSNITSTSATSDTFSVPANGIPYSFEVSAVDAAGESPLSAAFTPIPAAPSGLEVNSVTANSVSLSWNASTEAGGYRVLNETTNTYNTISSGTTTSFTDTTVQPGTTYAFVVYGTNGSGTSAASGSVTATTLAAAPSNLAVTGVTSSSMSLGWTAPAGSGSYSYVVDELGLKQAYSLIA
jgi:fibronectin type 3 domain-containing protein